MEFWALLIGIIALGCTMILHMLQEAKQNRVLSLNLEYDHFPDHRYGLRLFFITDIHRRLIDFSIIDRVRGKADFVIIGGDLAERGVKLSQIRENLRRLKRIGPVFFIWGNNDYELGRDQLLELFKEERVHVLENEHIMLHTRSGKKIALIGVGEIAFDDDDLEQAVSGVDRDVFKILCCHNPKIVDQITEEQQIDLTICGHTHGGQINLFGIAPYPLGGFFHLEKTDLLVSNGYGTTKLPLRFRAKVETHIITIKGKS